MYSIGVDIGGSKIAVGIVSEEMKLVSKRSLPNGVPAALPNFLDGCKVAMPLAVIGAVVGEFVGSNDGLGNLILTASGSGHTTLTFAALIAVTVLSLLLFYGVAYWERFIWWRAA